MERRIEDEPITTLHKESDDWIRHLEEHGVVRLLGAPDDPCRVVAITENLWRRAITQWSPQSPMHGREGISSQATQESSTSDPPRPPAEFIEELRRQRVQKRASIIKVGPFSVPQALQHIAAALFESRSMLECADHHGSESQVVLEQTWERAASFVLTASISFWRARHIVPPVPLLSSDLEGGIDVVWPQRHRTLYMNIPEEPANVVTFFGRDQKNPELRFRGEEDSGADGDWILGWLIR